MNKYSLSLEKKLKKIIIKSTISVLTSSISCVHASSLTFRIILTVYNSIMSVRWYFFFLWANNKPRVRWRSLGRQRIFRQRRRTASGHHRRIRAVCRVICTCVQRIWNMCECEFTRVYAIVKYLVRVYRCVCVCVCV